MIEFNIIKMDKKF